MFFSVIKYYTKTNKNITLKQSETKNSVKKTKTNKISVYSVSPCENIKNKLRRGVAETLCLRVRIKTNQEGVRWGLCALRVSV